MPERVWLLLGYRDYREFYGQAVVLGVYTNELHARTARHRAETGLKSPFVETSLLELEVRRDSELYPEAVMP